MEHSFIKIKIPHQSFQLINTDIPDTPNEELNIVKSKFDDMPAHVFRKVMRNVEAYYGVKGRLRDEYNVEYATNASSKMYELIHEFNLINCNEDLTAFCNAELPGTFIIVINHYFKTNSIMKFDWCASSYYGAKENIGDDFKLYETNLDKWLMGVDHNGDLTDYLTVEKIIKQVYSRFPNGVKLYTCDGGMDSSSDYNNQEKINAKLNLGQILTGVSCLATGGNFVSKQYTVWTGFTKSIMAMMSSMFEEFYICKPLTSRPTNSETYLVGLRFIDNPAARTAMFDRLKSFNLSSFISDVSNLNFHQFDIQQIAHMKNALSGRKIADKTNDWFQRYNIKKFDGTIARSAYNTVICGRSDDIGALRKKITIDYIGDYPMPSEICIFINCQSSESAKTKYLINSTGSGTILCRTEKEYASAPEPKLLFGLYCDDIYDDTIAKTDNIIIYFIDVDLTKLVENANNVYICLKLEDPRLKDDEFYGEPMMRFHNIYSTRYISDKIMNLAGIHIHGSILTKWLIKSMCVGAKIQHSCDILESASRYEYETNRRHFDKFKFPHIIQ